MFVLLRYCSAFAVICSANIAKLQGMRCSHLYNITRRALKVHVTGASSGGAEHNYLLEHGAFDVLIA